MCVCASACACVYGSAEVEALRILDCQEEFFSQRPFGLVLGEDERVEAGVGGGEAGLIVWTLLQGEAQARHAFNGYPVAARREDKELPLRDVEWEGWERGRWVRIQGQGSEEQGRARRRW